jgi:hypothetical protein
MLNLLVCIFTARLQRVNSVLSLQGDTETVSENTQDIPDRIPCLRVNYTSYELQLPPFPIMLQNKFQFPWNKRIIISFFVSGFF